MNARLMYRDRDFELSRSLQPHQADVKNDLELDVLLKVMADDDGLIYEVAQAALMGGVANNADAVRYRQAILMDAIRNPDVVRKLYQLTAAALEGKRHHYFGIFLNYPSGILHDALDLMRVFVAILRKMRGIADTNISQFTSEGFSALLKMLQAEFSDAYFEIVEQHLAYLKLKGGVLESAQLGRGNEGVDHVLRKPNDADVPWLARLLRRRSPAYTFRIAERDEAGYRALSELRDRGVNLVANALAQSTEHMLSFFEMLRMELAFYIGCLNLRTTLSAMEAPVAIPVVAPPAMGELRFAELYDPCLALSMGHRIVGNSVDVGRKPLVIVTGANQGGKSSFLRSIGLAQLMMQGGMFVAAESFTSALHTGLFTHYRREEDDTLKSGKFDEELLRMSRLAEQVSPGAMMLFNESFASTNEREGSEVSRQIVEALLDCGVRVFFVTHMYDLAHSFVDHPRLHAHFLRAQRMVDGTRTFKLIGEVPQETSYGDDLYREVFSSG